MPIIKANKLKEPLYSQMKSNQIAHAGKPWSFDDPKWKEN